MDIKREIIGELNELLIFSLIPTDYQENVNKAIRDQSKKAKLPGFRQGMVPEGHVRKLYGKNILVTEINHILSNSLSKFLEENHINLLGGPLPLEEGMKLNWEEEGNFVFKYELGIAPVLDVSKYPTKSIKAYSIKVEPETLEARIQNLRKAYGKMTNPEVSESGDVLYLHLGQISDLGILIENGIDKKASLRTDLIKDEGACKILSGLKKGDFGRINLGEAFQNDFHALGHLLDIPEETASKLVADFNFEVININRLSSSDLDATFFLKLFPEGNVNNETEFREVIKGELVKRMEELSEARLNKDLVQLCLKHFASVLPHQFLRKWLLSRKEERYTESNIKESYPEFEKNLKWSLISGQLANMNQINVDTDEILGEVKQRLRNQFRMYSPEPIEEAELHDYSIKILQNRDQVNQVFEELRNIKVLAFLKTKVTLDLVEIGQEEFLKLN